MLSNCECSLWFMADSIRQMFLRALVLLLFMKSDAVISEYYNEPGPCSSQTVSACINGYLERDFPTISAYIHGDPTRANHNNGKCPSRVSAENQFQEFGEDCLKLQAVFRCLRTELENCRWTYSFFLLRHLLYTMREILFVVCGTASTENISKKEAMANLEARKRFLVLLDSVECLECIRTNVSTVECSSEGLVVLPNLWNKVLRLEVTPIDLCSNLTKQIACIKSRKLPSAMCGQKTEDIYVNLTNIFISSWCDRKTVLSPANFLNRNISALVLSTIFIAICTKLLMTEF